MSHHVSELKYSWCLIYVHKSVFEIKPHSHGEVSVTSLGIISSNELHHIKTQEYITLRRKTFWYVLLCFDIEEKRLIKTDSSTSTLFTMNTRTQKHIFFFKFRNWMNWRHQENINCLKYHLFLSSNYHRTDWSVSETLHPYSTCACL
jgi:hypothetical protein